jgi:tetratricopeptide (TPR) repeat protein
MSDATATLEDNRIRYLNNMRTELLDISWKLLKKYNISDKYRLTEKQINEFIEATKNKDPDLKFRIMQRLLKDNPAFEEFPEFWYQYALAANNSHSLSNDEVLDLLFEFDRTYKNLFRRYFVYASVAMERIMLLPSGSPQIKKDLEIILANSSNQDWQNYLFAGIKYAELGELEKARKMFQRNIDNGNEVSLNARLLSETFDATDSSYQDLLEKMLADNRVSNADKLYMIGKARNIDYLNKFKNQIEAIQIQTKESRNPTHHGPLYFVTIPLDWLLEEGPFSLELFVDGQLYGRTFDSLYELNDEDKNANGEPKIILGEKGSFIGGDPADSLKLKIIHPLIELDLEYIKLPDERGFFNKMAIWIPFTQSTLANYSLESIKYNGELYVLHDGKFQKR